MDSGRTRLIVLVLGDPHLLEGGEGGKDGATDPDRVLAFGRSDNLDLHGGRGEVGELLGETLSDAVEHGGSTGEDDVAVEILTDVNVALADAVERGGVDALSFHTDEVGLEEHLRAAEALVPDSDDVAVRELVALLE